ncbi:MAG: Rrf2 family transcriptional regulator [Acidobacteria bacterium]|nr:Rrf2 family transcriptional regulator [Acidobacteriota bacterium]
MSFNLTRKTDYALIALSQLAQAWTQSEGPVSARTIADAYDLPAPLLMNILKQLHHAHLLDSKRGINGGYQLMRDPRNISLLQVIEALEGRVNLALCTESIDESHNCQIEDQCPISHPIQRFNSLLNNFLKTMTLADLVDDPNLARPLGVPV